MELSSVSFIYIVLYFIFLSVHLQEHVYAEDDKQYETCTRPFNCGTVQNISYPFYDGHARPDYCGYPGFQLDCSASIAEISVTSTEKYYLIGVKPDQPILSVARKDFWEGYCPRELLNTSINFTLFNYTTLDENIALYYKCANATTPKNQFFCANISYGDDFAGYFVPEDLESVVAKYDLPLNTCKKKIIVPISNYESADARITDELSLLTAFKYGFELEWIAENSLCLECQVSGGACGYNTSANRFTCYCPDHPYDIKCPGKKSSNNAVIIGIAIAGGLIAAFVALCSLFYVRRRKRLLSQTQNKDFHPGALSSQPLSSNGFHSSLGYTTSPSTHLSHQSIPSYTSSKSDLENSNYLGLDVKLFSYVELEEATENFHESRELGDGGFGTVYYGELQDGRVVAVKRLYENSVKRMGQFMNEVKILARLRHKNLVTLYGCTSKRSRDLLLVYEYIPNGTVADHLHGKYAESNKLPWNTRLSIAVETAEALAFLHENDVIHRDVKTTNILLDSNFQVKVADFGLSRLFPNDVTHVSTAPQGTPGYVDPDYYQCYRLTEKSDVYSFGVVLMELISSKLAVDITRHRHDINLANMAVDRIQKHALQELVDPKLGYDKDYLVQKMVKLVAELAFQCLQQDSEMRPSMKEVLESLKAIQKELTNAQKQVVVDIHVQESDDDVGLLKNVPPPLSPETETTNRR